MNLPIDAIRAVAEAQPRAELSAPTIAEYAEALRAGAEFPPVTVFFDGVEHWLADGFHRLAAFRSLQAVSIPVYVREGGRRDAVLFSVGANSKHGLPRTNHDKRRAVETLLKDEEWGAMTDRWIAEQAAVTHPFVSRIRAELSGNGYQKPDAIRIGRDGRRIRPVETRRAEHEALACGASAAREMPKRAEVSSPPQPEPIPAPADLADRGGRFAVLAAEVLALPNELRLRLREILEESLRGSRATAP